MKKLLVSNAGFTLIEILITLAILMIVGTAGVASLQKYTEDSQTKSLNEKAKTIFSASQDAFQYVKNNSMEDYSLNNQLILNAVGNNWTHGPSDWTNEAVRKNLYYLTINKNDPNKKTKELYELLSRYVDDQDLLNNTILIEFNAESGLVSSVFYSEMADSFDYGLNNSSNSNGVVSVYNREPNSLKNRRIGFYGNARTYKSTHDLTSFKVTVENGIKLAVHWTNPSLKYLTGTNGTKPAISYKVVLYNKARNKILATYNITPQTHGYTSGEENILILDELKTTNPSDQASDFIKTMPISSFIAVVEAKVSSSNIGGVPSTRRASSKVSHTVFRSEKVIGEKKYYYIDNIRHLNNIRYGSSDSSYIQTNDLSISILGSPGYTLKPLKNFPTRTNLGLIDQTKPGVSDFNGNYNGNQRSIEIKVSDSNYNNQTDGVGLFSVLGASGRLENISLINSQFIGNVNVATLVGINKGEIRYCSGVKSAVYGTLGLGGLVAINKNKISECYTSNVRAFGEDLVGGLVGDNNSGTLTNEALIENCYVSGIEPDDIPNNIKSLIDASNKKTMLFGAITGQNKGIVRYCYSNIYVLHKYKDHKNDDPNLIIGNPEGNLPIKSFILSEKNFNENFDGPILTFDEMTNSNAFQLFKNNGFQDTIWEVNLSKSSPINFPYLKLKKLKHFGEWPKFIKHGNAVIEDKN
ncbi:MAG: hypothetical protein K0R71_249 [Bacillales bacterium]|jgi:prepilin-type N-terminal cleavage/methylation domain-containing protein|nr:hypothetical protein [Bacillales bacterium]